MEKRDFDKNTLIKLIKQSYKIKRIRLFLIENCMVLNDELIDIYVIKFIDNHPINNFKRTMLCLLGHKKLKLNVLMYIASLGYYPEAFYSALIEISNKNLTHGEFVLFLDNNIKYIMETDEFVESINYIDSIPSEKKKEIMNYLKKNRIIN